MRTRLFIQILFYSDCLLEARQVSFIEAYKEGDVIRDGSLRERTISRNDYFSKA